MTMTMVTMVMMITTPLEFDLRQDTGVVLASSTASAAVLTPASDLSALEQVHISDYLKLDFLERSSN